jgi:PAS domain-containing protein
MLSHTQNSFSVEFSALSFRSPSTNRYRYMLEGLDADWYVVGSDRRLARYITLPPGAYTLRVQGATSRGPWSEPGAVLDFSTAPPYWQTLWFRTACGAALLLVLWALYRLRLRQIAQAYNARLKLVAIVESSSDAIIGNSLDGIVISWNRGAEQIFGYAAEEVVGKLGTILIPPQPFG